MWPCNVRARAPGIGWGGWLLAMMSAGCRPSDVLSVPPPAGVVTSGSLANQSGAEGALAAARAQLFYAADGFYFSGLLSWSGMLADELTFSGFAFIAGYANIDARETVAQGGFLESADRSWQSLLQARAALIQAVPGLAKYEPASAQSSIGEAYALAGYAELLIAESYCSGSLLSQIEPGGRIDYGQPITNDSLLVLATAHFDSAVAHANGDPTVLGLASVGLGRALLDRGQYAGAAVAVQSVPTSFAYNVELPPTYNFGTTQFSNPYAWGIQDPTGRIFNVADVKGMNGLNFISGNDPRLTFDTTMQTYDGLNGGAVPGTWYLPLKFETNLTLMPLATGIEARLIQAEAALQAQQSVTWAGDLNTLRADSADTKVVFQNLLPADSTTTAPRAEQVDVMFRERAFWLFGTGTRLGDLRRLVRQYGRDPSTVFPTGAYPNGGNPFLPAPIPSYGTDVSLTLPTPQGLTQNRMSENNPNYRGCIVSTKTA